MNRTQLINSLIKEHGFKSYLEIGLGKGINFLKIDNPLEFNKVGVEPNINFKIEDFPDYTVIKADSDYFFDKFDYKFDLIFIDGYHTAEQVEKDIVNSWSRLNKGGVILLHDINPPTKESQEVPKVSSPWKGTVWRAFVGFMNKYPKIKAYTTNHDTGIGWIWKSKHKVDFGFIEEEMTYEEFDANRGELLRVKI
jgi:predicted O-methyltransferase YrrM